MTINKLYITHLIKNAIKKKKPNVEVILFGQQARNDSNDDSDWDILILSDKTNVSRFQAKEYRDALYDIELEIGQSISTFIFSKTDWEGKHKFTPLYNNIKKDGIYIS